MNEFYTPPLLITEYYDSLIRQLDIYTEERIKELQETGLPKIEVDSYSYCSTCYEQTDEIETYGVETINNPYQSKQFTIDTTITETEITELSQAIDYVSKIRQQAIDEIRKVQEENLDHYNENKDKFKVDKKENLTGEKLDEFKSQLFAPRFCFLVNKTPIESVRIYSDSWIRCRDRYMSLFNLHTVITDFYLRESDIDFIRFEEFIKIKSIIT